MTTTPDITTAVDRAKREITDDIAAGRVPADVGSFSELHDYVDANEYGGLTEWDLDDLATEQGLAFADRVQTEVDAWIRGGRR